MPKLIFGNQLHIDYAQAKPFEKTEIWNYHNCGCEHCKDPEISCPDCGCEDKPEDYQEKFGIVQCPDCKKLFFRGWREQREVKGIIEEYNKSKNDNC